MDITAGSQIHTKISFKHIVNCRLLLGLFQACWEPTVTKQITIPWEAQSTASEFISV